MNSVHMFGNQSICPSISGHTRIVCIKLCMLACFHMCFKYVHLKSVDRQGEGLCMQVGRLSCERV